MNRDPFSYYRFGLSDNTVVRGTANSAYHLFMAVGAVGLLLTILLIGIKLASADPGKRRDALEEIKWKAAIAVILFAMSSVIGMVMSFAGVFAG